MMKRLAVLIFLVSCSAISFAQDMDKSSNVASTTLPISKPARDFLLIQFGYNNWLNKPDSVKTKGFAYNFSAFLCYDFPIKNSKLSFATGVGINANVMYLDKEVLKLADTGTAGSAVQFQPDLLNYKRYKVVTTYLTAPFELRYFSNKQNRNRGFKASAGLQIGTLLGAHTKGLRSINGTNVKEKVDTKSFITTWNFAATASVGYGHFALYGSYNLTNVFKTNDGPPITPMSIGIRLTGL
jgi:hypothetical protein